MAAPIRAAMALSLCALLLCACESGPSPHPTSAEPPQTVLLREPASERPAFHGTAAPSAGPKGEAPQARSSELRGAEPVDEEPDVKPDPFLWSKQIRPHHKREVPFAFTRFRFARLTLSGIKVWSTRDFTVRAKPEAPDLFGLLPLTGGAFLALGQRGTYRLSGRDTRFARFSRFPWLGEPEVFQDPTSVLRFLVRYADDPAVFEFELDPDEKGVHRPKREIPLPGARGRPVTLLGMGHFFFVQNESGFLVSPGAPNTPKELSLKELQLGRAVGLLPARYRADVWHIAEGRARVLRLSPTVRERVQCPFDGTPYQAASSGERLALVLVHQLAKPHPHRRWELQVLDTDCRSLFRVELPPSTLEHPLREVSEEIQNRAVSLSPNGRLVAVGGRGWTRVYDVTTGRLRLVDPPADRSLEVVPIPGDAGSPTP